MYKDFQSQLFFHEEANGGMGRMRCKVVMYYSALVFISVIAVSGALLNSTQTKVWRDTFLHRLLDFIPASFF